MNTARLRFREPLRLLVSPAPWAALGYLVTSIFLGVLTFSVATTLLAVGVTLGLLWLGLPVLVFASASTRALANVERRRLRPRIAAPYRSRPSGPFRARLAARLRDPATRRDLVLLVVLWPALFVIDTVATTFWLGCFGLISLPIWYRFIPNTFDNGSKAHGIALGYYPNGPYGGNHWGFFVHDDRSAFLAAAAGLVLLIVAGNYVVVAAARAHATVVRLLLSRARDPLAEARAMLTADPNLAKSNLTNQTWSA
ncbi:MAG TPA: sensor domain-containing protein [Jatrophihabitantaceae bacterium]